ncbi:DMT family transporter [Candidatus Hepatincolaceae symbiont of Richtersius coronifer]
MEKKYYPGVLLGFISCFFYALLDLFAKFALSNQGISFFSFYFYINLIAALILLSYIIFKYFRHKVNVLRFKSPFVFLMIILSMISFSSAFISLSKIPLDIYYSIIFTTPVLSTTFGVLFLKEELNHKKVIAIALGFIGIALITNPFNITKYNLSVVGILLAFVVTTCDICIGVTTRKFLQKENAFTVRAYLFVISAIFGAFLLKFNNQSFHIGSVANFNIVLLSAICIVIAALTFLKAYQLAPISLVSTTYYSFIIWGVIFGYFVFKDVPNPLAILGCLLILLSNIYLYLDVGSLFRKKSLRH